MAAGFLVWGTSIGVAETTNTPLVDLWIPTALFPIAIYFFLRYWLDVSAEVGIAETRGSRATSRVATLVLILSLLCALIVGVLPDSDRIVAENPIALLIPAVANAGPTFLMFACFAAALRVLLKTPPVSTNKVFWVATSLLGFFALYIFKGILVTLFFVVSLDLSAPWIGPVYSVLEPIQPLCALAFIYVCLAKRLINFNFVVNRFLVYTVAGGLLIIGFWTLKSSLEAVSTVDEESRKNLVNGGAALLIFIAKQFSGVTDAFLKKTIFTALGRREQDLKRFIDEMGYFESPGALKSAFQTRFSAFAHGAAIEVFERRDGVYVGRVGGQRIAADDPLPVGLRAAKIPMLGAELGNHSEFRLVLPGFHRAVLVGFVAIAESPEIPAIRPDEIRLMQRAIQQLLDNLAFLELEALKRGDRQ